MLKAIKENMKIWLKTHERLYWYIVIGIAALAFGIVTGMGCAKLERAEAAQGYYSSEHALEICYERLVTDYGEDKACEYSYYVVALSNTNWTLVQFSKSPFYVIQNNYGALNVWFDDSVYSYQINPQGQIFDSSKELGNINLSNQLITLCNHDLYYGDQLYREKDITVEYFPDAPYVAFDSVSLSNLYLDGKPKLFHIGSTFDNKTKGSAWGFTGHLSEWDVTGATEYKLHIEYTVELPTWKYVKQLCEIKEIPYYGWDTCDASAELRHVWNTNENIPKYVYNFIYPINFNNDSGASEGGYIDLNTGLINFYLSFEQIEALIQYFNEDAFSELRNDEAYEKNSEEIRAHYLSYLHIDQVRVVVHADTVGSSVYGPMSVFSFQRDMKKAPLHKVVNIDYMTEIKDSVEDAVNENLMDGLEEYYKDLQTQLDDLQNQIDDIYSVGEGFGGHLEDTDLWSGFQNLAEGLGSLGPSVANISVLTGQVLSFLPLPISNIMYFTIFALCVVAIIKAIRG